MDRGTLAARYFTQGYNCAQSVALAFTDVTGLTPEQSARMVSGFGGGVGRLREVCGAVSGMVFVASCLYGYDAPNPEAQQQLYALIQQLAGEFKAQTGSVICREILKNPPRIPPPIPGPQNTTPSAPAPGCATWPPTPWSGTSPNTQSSKKLTVESCQF